MPFPVQALIEGRGVPLSINPDTTLKSAFAQMIAHSYTQLPVLDEDRRGIGLINTNSVLRAISNFGLGLSDLRAKDALERVTSFRANHDLFKLLDVLRDQSAVLIVNDDGSLSGIITDYDAMEYFRQTNENTMLVRDIEAMIKEYILSAFTDTTGQLDSQRLQEAIHGISGSKDSKELRGRFGRALQRYLELDGSEKATPNNRYLQQAFESCFDERPESKSFEDLGLDEYRHLIRHKSCWKMIEPIFGVSQDALDRLLVDIRNTRNDLSHGRENITPQQRDQLRFCKEWLEHHRTANPGRYVVSPAVEETATAQAELVVSSHHPHPTSSSNK